MRLSKHWRALVLSAAALGLVACGGGGDDSSVTPAPVPETKAAIVAPANVTQGDSVVLDAKRSTGVGDLTYEWSLQGPANSTAALSASTAVETSFSADLPGVYHAKLTIKDSQGTTATDETEIVASKAIPIAVPAQTVIPATTGLPVTLDATASTSPEGLPLNYRWTLESRPPASAAELKGATTSRPTLLPDADGEYLVQLIVSDANDSSTPVQVRINAIGNAYNNPPVANAGEAQIVTVGTKVTLDGSKSTDSNGDTLRYRWVLVARATGSVATLIQADTATPSFTPDVVGSYRIGLYVYDGQVESPVSRVTIKAERDPAIANRAPIARWGIAWNGNNQAQTSSNISFSADESYDPDGDSLTYDFQLLAKPAGSNAALSSMRNVATLKTDAHGDYTVQVIAFDGTLYSPPITRTITARASPNQTPTAIISGPASILLGQTATLDGTGSTDPEGQPLYYQWTLQAPAGSKTVLSSATASQPSFVPDVAGPYFVTLRVNDGQYDNTFDRNFTVLAKKFNRPPTSSPVFKGKNVTPGMVFNIAADANISDPDGDKVIVAWNLQQKPEGSTSRIDGANSPSFAEFTPDLPGRYVFELMISDNIDYGETQTLTIDVDAARNTLSLDELPMIDGQTEKMLYFSHKIASFGSNIAKNEESTHKKYRLTAIDRDYTVVDLSAAESSLTYQGRIDGLQNGQVIRKGESVEFSLVSPVVASGDRNKKFIYVYYFRILETGQDFFVSGDISKGGGEM